jgi:hypothetical protein
MAVRKERWARRLAWLAVLLLAVPVPSWATSMLPQDLGKMASASTHILRGKVVSIESGWNVDKTLIVTDVLIEVTETFKGKSSPQATLELIGGRVEDTVLDVVGSPSFTIGEDVVVFATVGKDGRLRLPSLAQDKFTVERGSDGKEWIRNDEQTFGSLLPGAKLSSLDARGRLGLDEFRSLLVGKLRRQGGEP